MSAVLILEPDTALREEFCSVMESNGIAAIPADVAALAIERLREGGIDVAVVDFEMDGELEKLASGMQSLPDPPQLVLVSSSVQAPTLSARLGAAAFVPKPCSGQDLYDVVNGLIIGRPKPNAFDECRLVPMIPLAIKNMRYYGYPALLAVILWGTCTRSPDAPGEDSKNLSAARNTQRATLFTPYGQTPRVTASFYVGRDKDAALSLGITGHVFTRHP